MTAFLISIDGEASDAWSYGDQSGHADAEAAFESVGAHLVRVWDPPYETSRPWNWLVVTELSDPVESYDLLRRTGVEVSGVAPLDFEPASAENDVSIVELLPDRLTAEMAHTLHDYLAPGLVGPEMAVGPGVVVWPCCYGVGDHFCDCPYKKQ